MPTATCNNKHTQTLSFVYLKVSSNQNIPPEESEPIEVTDSNNNQPSPAPATPVDLPPFPPTNISLSTNHQTEPPMEVHHHGHVHEKKKWKEYLFQFFMLFLAVFCGFLAENQREHYVEKERAKNYARTMIEDLRKDIKEVKEMNNECLVILKAFDTIKTIVYAGVTDKKVRGSFYYFSRIGSIVPLISWNKATLTQIIQSGSLRYFTNSELVNKISYYYASATQIDGQQETDRRFREKTVEIRNKLLNNFHFSSYSGFNVSSVNLPDSLLIHQTPLQSAEPNLLNEYANSFENRRATLRNLTFKYFPDLIKTGNELIEMLSTEYHLK